MRGCYLQFPTYPVLTLFANNWCHFLHTDFHTCQIIWLKFAISFLLSPHWPYPVHLSHSFRAVHLELLGFRGSKCRNSSLTELYSGLLQHHFDPGSWTPQFAPRLLILALYLLHSSRSLLIYHLNRLFHTLNYPVLMLSSCHYRPQFWVNPTTSSL